MKKLLKIWWHEFWYKCYHLPRSVRGVKIVDGEVVRTKESEHHFDRAWHHGQEYQKLDPKGMKKFAAKCVMKGCKVSKEEAEKIVGD